MNDITTILMDIGALAGAFASALVALGVAVRTTITMLDKLDDRYPTLLPYTAWITDPSKRRPRGAEEK